MEIFSIILTLGILFNHAFADENSWNNNHKLREKLLKNYDKEALPQKFHNGTTIIYLGMFPRALRINDNKEWLIVESWLAMVWHDPRLKWDRKDYGDLKVAHFGDDELWKPDFSVYNNAEISEVDHYGNTHFLVYSYGVVVWVPPATTKSYCPLDLTHWPYDTHTCIITMGSWTSHGWQIDFNFFHNVSTIHMELYANTSSEWKIKKAKQWKKNYKFDCCEEPYPEMNFEFTVQRNSPSFSTVIVVPAVVLPLLLMVQFLLPVNHPKRMVIGFVCAVLVIMEMLFLKLIIPRVGSPVPLIVSYYSLSFVMVVLTIVLSAVLERLSHPQHPLITYPPGELVKRVLTGPLATVLCLQDHASKVGLSGKMAEDGEILDSGSSSPSYAHEWLLVAKATDRIAFIIFLVIFVLSIISFTSRLH